MITIPMGTDFFVGVDGLRNAQTEAYLNGATVTVTLIDPQDGSTVASSSTTCSYVASSNGRYEGIMDTATLSLIEGKLYIINYSATQGAANGVWRRQGIAKYQ